MSNVTEWFDLAELDRLTEDLNYFKNYRVKYHYHLYIEMYCEDAAKKFNFENLLCDLNTLNEFFIFSDEKSFIMEAACFQAYVKKEEIKGYAAAHAQA